MAKSHIFRYGHGNLSSRIIAKQTIPVWVWVSWGWQVPDLMSRIRKETLQAPWHHSGASQGTPVFAKDSVGNYVINETNKVQYWSGNVGISLTIYCWYHNFIRNCVWDWKTAGHQKSPSRAMVTLYAIRPAWNWLHTWVDGTKGNAYRILAFKMNSTKTQGSSTVQFGESMWELFALLTQFHLGAHGTTPFAGFVPIVTHLPRLSWPPMVISHFRGDFVCA